MSLLLCCGFCWGPVRTWGQERPSPAALKAAFVTKFVEFIEWPSVPDRASNAPIAIGILGEDPIARELAAVAPTLRYRGRSFQLVRCQAPEDVLNCELLLVGAGALRQWEPMLQRISTRPVLTIGDAPGFATQGGMIEFTAENGKIRFLLNLDAARRARLRVSSKLLQASKLVKTEER